MKCLKGFKSKLLDLVSFSKRGWWKKAGKGEFKKNFSLHYTKNMTVQGFEWMLAIRLLERAFGCWVLRFGVL